MKITVFDKADTQETIKLFKTVFTHSEGPEEGLLIETLVSELISTTSSEDLIGFVCKNEGGIIGCIFFSRLKFECQTSTYILSPVAVSTEYQGQGIGQKLINFGINHLISMGVELVFTYGDPKFYTKVGFSHINKKSAKPPFELTHPQGWLAQSLTNKEIKPCLGTACCVEALNKQIYW